MFFIVFKKPDTTHKSQNNFITHIIHIKLKTFSPSFYSRNESQTHTIIPNTHWIDKLKAILQRRFEFVAKELSGSNIKSAPQSHI